MKWLRFALALMLVAGVAAPEAVWADRGRSIRHHGHAPRVGIHIGVPLYWSWPWPHYGYALPYPPYPPYYVYPPVIREAPPIYIEREDGRDTERDRAGEERSSADGYWYYCDRPDGYYPYVRECPGGWERVAPRPPR